MTTAPHLTISCHLTSPHLVTTSFCLTLPHFTSPSPRHHRHHQVSIGIKPLVEISYCPSLLAANCHKQVDAYHGRICAPWSDGTRPAATAASCWHHRLVSP
jgi:hypothetical protein